MARGLPGPRVAAAKPNGSLPNEKQILEKLMAELELALESDRGAASRFKDQVWRALERARGARRGTPSSARSDSLLN